MAINFVLETGSGLTDATTYADLAEAAQIVEDFGLSWLSGFTDDQKKVALNKATQFVDQGNYGAWKGWRSSQDQALLWPRQAVLDDDGWYVDSNVIPANLKRAVVEAAVYYSNNDSLFPDTDNGGTLKSERIKIDVLEFEEEYLAGDSGSEVSKTINSLLAAYLRGRGCNVEVGRG